MCSRTTWVMLEALWRIEAKRLEASWTPPIRTPPRMIQSSAGSQPKGAPHPQTIALLSSLGYETDRLRSKSWNEFAQPGAPQLDFIFTVCDNAAGETCPFWPGQPMTAHWGVPDPAAATGSAAEIALAFRETYRMLHRRIDAFTALPVRSLDEMSLQDKLQEIGRMEGATGKPLETN